MSSLGRIHPIYHGLTRELFPSLLKKVCVEGSMLQQHPLDNNGDEMLLFYSLGGIKIFFVTASYYTDSWEAVSC